MIDSTEVKCRKCHRFLGYAKEDGQYLQLGENARLYITCRFSCRCGFPFVFVPHLPPDTATAEQLEVANEYLTILGKKPKVAERFEIKKYRRAEK